jgi:lipopolysaccharide export system permease protein
MESETGSPATVKQIDRLVIKELIGPWLFGVAMFASLLMAATYLNRIAEYIVRGLEPVLIFKVTMLLMPAILAKTFAMAMLLATLLAFGRLSSDSEVTALRAAGASIVRIVWPVMVFSVAVVTFFFNNAIVPPAEAKAQSLVLSIENSHQGKMGEPISFLLKDADKVQGQVVAEAFDLLNKKLYNVTVIAYDDAGNASMYMHCNQLEYHPENKYWHITGGAAIVPADGGQKTTVAEAWPSNIPSIKDSPDDINARNNKNLDIYSMAEMQRQIERGKRTGSLSSSDIHNLEFGYWNKISVALAAFIFGTLGAVLGIRSQRTSAASGFALAIAIIFGYFTLVNFMNVWALNGILPAWGASFAPIAIGLVCSGVIMWRRNS